MIKRKYAVVFFIFFFLNLSFGQQGKDELLSPAVLEKIAGELSGKICFEHVRDLSVFCKWYGSEAMEKAAAQVEAKAKKYGLRDAHLEKFRVDSDTYYWMQKPWLGWNCEFGELRMVKPFRKLISSYEANSSCVLVYSRDADVEAEVVYVGEGTELKDYEGRDVKGKIVLASGSPWDVSRIAVYEKGAAGILAGLGMSQIGYTSTTIYQLRIKPWNEDKTKLSTFGFSLSPIQARDILKLLDSGEKVVLQAKVKAEVRDPGYHLGVVATIPGSVYPDEEIIFTAHLDHPRPGAHDNNSGCAVLLEVARAINTLVQRKEIEPPKRTLRFYWAPHVWGCEMLFSKYPELFSKTIANINIDCVGLDQTKVSSAFFVAQPPFSRASFLNDVGHNILDYLVLNNNVDVGTLSYKPKIIDDDGSKNIFNGRAVPFIGYSDHVFFNSGSVEIPAVMMGDLPTGSHHSQNDKLELLDPTQLKRVSFLAASMAYTIAATGPEDSFKIIDEIYHRARTRIEMEMKRAKSIFRAGDKGNVGNVYKSVKNLVYSGFRREEQALRSTQIFIKENKEASSYLDSILLKINKFEKDCLEDVQSCYALRCRQLDVKPEIPGLSEEERQLKKIVPVLDKKLKGIFGRLNEYPFEKYQLPDLMPDIPYYFELFNLMDGHRNMLDIFWAVESEALSANYQTLSFKEIMKFLELLKEADIISYKN